MLKFCFRQGDVAPPIVPHLKANTLAVAVIAILFAVVAPSARADLYVSTSGSDTAACTQSAPCKTFNGVYRKAPANATVQVAAGDYGAQAMSADATKVADTDPTNGVQFVANGVVKAMLDLNKARGVGFSGMILGNTGNSGDDAADLIHVDDIAITGSTFTQRVYVDDAAYVTFSHDTWEPRGGAASQAFESGWGLAIFQQAGERAADHIVVDSSTFHGIRATQAVDHPDAIFVYHTDQGAGVKNSAIRNSRFYNNECINLRTDPGDDLTIENNFFGSSFKGISGCGYYSIDVYEANAKVRYNTFEQEIQVLSTFTATQEWVGNVGPGMSSACGVTNAAAVMRYNVWTNQKCSSTDKKVASLGLAADLRLAAGSPAIDAGDPTAYPPTDADGHVRPIGFAPDAGANEYGSVGTPLPDTTAPDTTITSAPASSTTATSASLSFTATESATFACRIDGGAWTSCSSPQAYSGLAVGAHTFDVRATDTAGNVDASPATATWTVTTPVDTTPPNTTITSAPSGSTTATSASLAFSATEVVTFECRMDGGAWGACNSPKAYSSLAVGVHTFDVRATDLAGNVDLTPASAGWTVVAAADTTPPDTAIVSGPSGSTTSTSASLAFSATESATFECRLDGGAWTACTSPKAYSGLAVGAHTFDVRATDTAGNVDLSPASRAWTVTAAADTTAPDTTITSGPTGSGTATSASLGFTASEAGSTFECRLDGGTWASCASPKAYAAMSVGTHTFDVRATDAAGNTDASPASRSWTVAAVTDTTAPDTTITGGPAASTTLTTASVSFTSTESGSTFQCRLDAGTWNVCASPEGEAGLAVGAHTIDVRATDTAGNVDATPASWSWTVVDSAPPAPDTAAPDTNLTSGPTTVTTSRSATFEFTATESPATFRCSLDGSRWSTCSSPKDYSSLSRGKHTIRVRATDGAGNTDATPVAYSWSIVRRTYGATYSFEPLSGRSRATVQAGSLEGACALVSGSHARLGVRLSGLHVRRGHSAMRISGKVPELAQDGVNARVRVSVRSHGRWHLIASRRVHVRFDGSFRVKAPRRSGKLKVTAVARCG